MPYPNEGYAAAKTDDINIDDISFGEVESLTLYKNVVDDEL